jgi:hypothetical protein
MGEESSPDAASPLADKLRRVRVSKVNVDVTRGLSAMLKPSTLDDMAKSLAAMPGRTALSDMVKAQKAFTALNASVAKDLQASANSVRKLSECRPYEAPRASDALFWIAGP